MFEFTTHTVATRRGPRHVVEMRPTQTCVLGRARLEFMRRETHGSGRPSHVERELRAFVRDSPVSVSAVVMRCRTDEGSWGTDPSLAEAEGRELVDRLLEIQLPLYRELLEQGVKLIVHVETAAHDVAMFRAALEVAAAEAGTSLIRQRVVYFTSSFDSAMTTLADLLPGIESRGGLERARG